MLNIIALDNQENFLDFIDPDLVDIVETNSDGLKSISLSYIIDDLPKAKNLFKSGNKLWVGGHDDDNDDCLYVMNAPVKQELYSNNLFNLDAEEVLVELNYVGLFNQNDLTVNNGFTISTNGNESNVTVNWNALNYWFGDYFNIGIVQECISDYAGKITLTGTKNLMNLLRYIEEETGNIFVTRYEKDVNSNVIHRYLDFLNPDNENKKWELNLHYDFEELDDTVYTSDEDGNFVDDTYEDGETEDDLVEWETVNQLINLNPENTVFRISYDNDILVSDDGVSLEWVAEDINFGETTESCVIRFKRDLNNIGMSVETLNYPSNTDETTTLQNPKGFIIENSPSINISNIHIPNGACIEFYDTELEKVVYSHKIYPNLNEYHEDILDLGFNLEEVSLTNDESDTFYAISPVLSLSESSDSINSLSRTDLSKIISKWVNLEVTQGDYIPMILQKFNKTGTSLSNAKSNMGTLNIGSNYWSRPVKPNDNTDSTDKTYEFIVGTAYWRAPFTKLKGDLYISLDSISSIDYSYISGRPDTRDVQGTLATPKMGTVDTSEEDPYAIYNAVALKLKEKLSPNIDVDVDVSELKNGLYNNFHVYDKVYIKIPGTSELITAVVEKTVKNPHNISENKIILSNYSINQKVITKETYIDASNAQYKYPNKKDLPIILVNGEYDSSVESDVQFLAGKLLNITVYKIEDNQRNFYKNYTKKTNSNGLANLVMNWKPADYEVEIVFGGDSTYSESNLTINVSVSGTVAKKKKTTTTKKKKSTTTTVKKKRYYDKYGRSPDKKTILAIGLPSAGRDKKLKNKKYWSETEFKNWCPHCKKEGVLAWSIFYAGNEYSNWGRFPATGNMEGGSAEGHIFCMHCDADYSVQGHEHINSSKYDLKVTKKRKSSSKSKAYELKKGNRYYDTVTTTKKGKQVENTKNRSSGSSGINSKIRKKALSIVGDKRGLSACKEIAKFFTKVSWVNYNGYQRSPVSVLNSMSGNCCDQTRLMLQMMDAVGVIEDGITLRWIHVVGGKGGHVFARVEYTNSKGKKVQTIVDPTAIRAGPWGHYAHGYGSYPSQIRHSPKYTGPNSRAF